MMYNNCPKFQIFYAKFQVVSYKFQFKFLLKISKCVTGSHFSGHEIACIFQATYLQVKAMKSQVKLALNQFCVDNIYIYMQRCK